MLLQTKVGIGDKIFYLSKIKKVPCHVCNGTGKITLGEPINPNLDSLETFMTSVHEEITKNMMNMVLGQTKQYNCPECHGKGMLKATGQIKYEVHSGSVYAISTKVVSDKATIIYTVTKEDGNTFPINENEMWINFEDAVKQCDFLNLERRLIPIECIQIPKSFADTIPHNEKLLKRLDEWRNFKKLQTEIYVDETCKLFDGYTSYLIYRMLGVADIPVVIWPKNIKSE